MTVFVVSVGHSPCSVALTDSLLCKEPECCDGSDEPSGICPNVCEQVGKEHRARLEAENKIRKKGAKIRSSYIAYAKKEKKRLEDLVAATSQDVAAQEKEVARLKGLDDRFLLISGGTNVLFP